MFCQRSKYHSYKTVPVKVNDLISLNFLPGQINRRLQNNNQSEKQTNEKNDESQPEPSISLRIYSSGLSSNTSSSASEKLNMQKCLSLNQEELVFER